LTLRSHFFDLSADPDVPILPLERLDEDVEVVVTRSHPVADRLAPVTRQGNAIRYTVAHYMRYHADLQGSFDQYLQKFSGKTRNTLRRKVRHFLSQGVGSGIREFKRPDQMAEFCHLARTVSALTYQERLLNAGLPSDAAFVERLIDMAHNDAVRAYVLMLNGEAIAYLCCPAIKDVLLYTYLGYDPAHADLSPGTVLQYLAFEALFAEHRFRAFDFTEGQGEHKQFFGTHAALCADVCYFRRTLSSYAWIGAHRILNALSIAAAHLLDRWGLKSVVKRFLRRRWGTRKYR
jgi:CelD/BcsL family acetyltransferase involved in cellulose biosynthesis